MKFTESEVMEMKAHMHTFVKEHVGAAGRSYPTVTGLFIEEFDNQFGGVRWDGDDAAAAALVEAFETLEQAAFDYVDAFIDMHVGVKKLKTFKVQGNLDGPFLGTFAQFVGAYDEIEAEEMVRVQFGSLVIIRSVKEFDPNK